MELIVKVNSFLNGIVMGWPGMILLVGTGVYYTIRCGGVQFKWFGYIMKTTIGKIFETNHAFSIESDTGIELFVHFGIDTVELKGEGFKRIAEEGQRVKVGDTVIEFDLPLLEEKAKSTLTPVVISNMDEIKELIKLSGSVTVGETPVIRIKK